VLVTGDLKFHRSLVTAARDVDVLVSDAISLMMTRAPGTGAGNAGRDRTAAIMHDIEDYHITPEQAAQVANDGREPARLLSSAPGARRRPPARCVRAGNRRNAPRRLDHRRRRQPLHDALRSDDTQIGRVIGWRP
jgi:hypothetical protein